MSIAVKLIHHSYMFMFLSLCVFRISISLLHKFINYYIPNDIHWTVTHRSSPFSPKLILCRRNNQMIFLGRALRKSVIHQVSPMIIRPSKLIRIPLNVAFVSYIRSFIHPFILSHEHTLWFILDIFLWNRMLSTDICLNYFTHTHTYTHWKKVN